MTIACGHCHGRHESVTEVRHCSRIDPTNTARTVDPVSSWSLRSSGESPAHAAAVHAERVRTAIVQDRYGSDHADTPVPVQRTKKRAAEGMYRKAGTIYKVQKAVHGSGQNYAKRLVQTLVNDPRTGKPKFKFEYAPGFVFELRPEHALTIEQAKEFGALYGTCCVCGRTLTKEESIEAGIGPVCAEKF
jgi:hypothetical protein